MKRLIMVLMVLVFIGCGEVETVERETVSVPNDSIIVLDENQSIGFKPNSDVTIVNMGDNSYYIVCGTVECAVNIDNSIDNSTSDSSSNTSTVDSSSSTVTTDSSTTYVDNNSTEA
jgi:hypothetical protein